MLQAAAKASTAAADHGSRYQLLLLQQLLLQFAPSELLSIFLQMALDVVSAESANVHELPDIVRSGHLRPPQLLYCCHKLLVQVCCPLQPGAASGGTAAAAAITFSSLCCRHCR